ELLREVRLKRWKRGDGQNWRSRTRVYAFLLRTTTQRGSTATALGGIRCRCEVKPACDFAALRPRPHADRTQVSVPPIPDVPPPGYTSVAATADPLRRAPRTPDGRPVPAGLLARGSDASSSLPGLT